MGKDKYSQANVIQGLVERAELTTGEYCARIGANWDNDEQPEFLLSYDDPRYQRVLQFARQLKQQYPLENITDRREIVEREHAITTALTNKIHEEYGDYNPHIAQGANSGTHPTMHQDLQRSHTSPASLSEFKRDELICRHYAPLFAALSTEAGMQVFLVGGESNHFIIENNVLKSQQDQSGQSSGGHQFVVSRTTGNVIEATSKHGEDAYRIAVNGLTLEEVIAGATIVTANDFTVATYGTYRQDNPDLNTAYRTRLEQIRQGKLSELHYVKECTPAEEIRGNQAAVEQHYSKQRLAEKAEVARYDGALVKGVYPEVKTRLKCFDEAIRAGNLSRMRELINEVGVTKAYLADHLTECVAQQGSPEVAAFLIDHGALKGYSSSYDKASIPFIAQLNKGVEFNPALTRMLIEKLEINPNEYFSCALKSRWPQHIELALDITDPKSFTHEHKAQAQAYLQDALKRNWRSDIELGLKMNPVETMPQDMRALLQLKSNEYARTSNLATLSNIINGFLTPSALAASSPTTQASQPATQPVTQSPSPTTVAQATPRAPSTTHPATIPTEPVISTPPRTEAPVTPELAPQENFAGLSSAGTNPLPEPSFTNSPSNGPQFSNFLTAGLMAVVGMFAASSFGLIGMLAAGVALGTAGWFAGNLLQPDQSAQPAPTNLAALNAPTHGQTPAHGFDLSANMRNALDQHRRTMDQPLDSNALVLPAKQEAQLQSIA